MNVQYYSSLYIYFIILFWNASTYYINETPCYHDAANASGIAQVSFWTMK